MCVPPQSECVPLLSRAEGCEAGERTDVRVGGLYQKYARVERDQGVEVINTASCAATEVAGTPLCRAEPAGRGAASRLACLEKWKIRYSVSAWSLPQIRIVISRVDLAQSCV